MQAKNSLKVVESDTPTNVRLCRFVYGLICAVQILRSQTNMMILRNGRQFNRQLASVATQPNAWILSHNK